MAWSILVGTVDVSFVQYIDHSREMTNSIQALKRPISTKISKTLTSFDYTLDTKTSKDFYEDNRSNGLLSIRITLWTLYCGHAR